ncbi:hypothetical protein BOTBODRAFT_51909 [Botryobasidium botryosum FD-172 SS1]|uniref:Large ribosomal subunit protein bL21m n=1 Tax=Botryobasidium botryosum (strain FD-172 SS1) TaxID=930990 RepID=A0A067N5X2_BOTB1|nr:hypothetical protein BOTBODRAFT_51909 [Botryobasidium botryosum FD-172 SS1]
MLSVANALRGAVNPLKARAPVLRAVHTFSAPVQRIGDLPNTLPAPSSLPDALNLIRSQPSHYVVASFLGRRYILAPRDLLTVPRMRDVKVGDVLSLDSIHELGSREFTIRGEPDLPKGAVSVYARVVEHTKGRMEEIVKKKRRKGYKKTIKHKQTYTRLRIGDIDIQPS